jgi:hypothetical protein
MGTSRHNIAAEIDGLNPVIDHRAEFSERPVQPGRGITFNGTTQHIDNPDILGSEGVVSSNGTSTPSITVAGQIDFTAGTCNWLMLDNGTFYAMEESSEPTVYDSGGLGNESNGTLIGSPTRTTDNTLPSKANAVGFTVGTGSNGAAAGVIIPRAFNTPFALDVLGNALEWEDSAFPRRPEYRDGYCSFWSGGIDHLVVAHLSGSETVVSYEGTSTPSISAGRIDFTFGTCSDLELSDGSIYTFNEGVGKYVHENSGSNLGNGLITDADTDTEGISTWSGRIDGENNSHNAKYGFTLFADALEENFWKLLYINGEPRVHAPDVPSGYSFVSQNPAIPNGNNGSETTLDYYKIASDGGPCTETNHLSNFEVVTMDATNYSVGTTSPIDTVFISRPSDVKQNRGIAFAATLTGQDLIWANNFSEGERWNDKTNWDDDTFWNEAN